MHPAIRSFRFTLALAFVLIALPALAATPVADVNLGFNSVTWTPQSEFAGLRLTVSGPDGNTWQNSFDANEAPQLDLSALGSAVDGLYTWELRATPVVDQVKMTGQSRTSEAGTRVRPKDLPSLDSLIQSGSFRVLNGTIVQPATEQDAPGLVVDTPGVDSATAGLERATAADNVILDDQIVDGSLCVGMDCVNGENFGFDTIRLKENNLRIHFQDTSNSGSFPTRDWRLVANGTGNGDAEYFSIQDAGTSRDVFYVEADAPSHALHVDSAGGGRIGIKTSAPVVDIHVVEGNTPTLRLEQDGSDGFNPQTWDVAGNEANFFIRDASNGSALPLRIYPSTGNDNLVLRNGRVGMGTNNPSSAMHLHNGAALIQADNATAKLSVIETNGTEAERDLLALENNGVARFVVEDTSADGSAWVFEAEGPSFRINKNGTGGEEIFVRDRNDGTGQATLVVVGSVQATNVTFSSSRALKTGFENVDPREVLTKLAALPMTEWQFKEDVNQRRHIGPIAEDFHAAFGLNDDPAHISTVDANGVTMAAVQGLYLEVQDRDQQITELREQLQQLQQLVETLQK